MTDSSRKPLIKRWPHVLSEPLLHFLALGALLFVLDQTLLVQRGDPRQIEVPPSVYEQARTLFSGNMKREPTERDLGILVDRWVDNEVLYREGLALGLDKGDEAIRDRVIFKSLGVVQAGLTVPPPDDALLKRWFEDNKSRYETQARFDFLEAVVTSERKEEVLKKFVEALNGKGKSDTESSLSVFRDRPRDNIEQSYGPEFLKGLESVKPGGAWALLASTSGPRVVRLMELKPGTKVAFESIRNEVVKDWRNEAMSKQTTQAVRELTAKYRVVRQEERK
ncbi:MAG: peptidylprolyl isomerase [Betaproteobacteria bacterium]